MGVMKPRAVLLDVSSRIGTEPDLEKRGGTENELRSGRDYRRNHSESHAGLHHRAHNP
jgi:hypothetical protein